MFLMIYFNLNIFNDINIYIYKIHVNKIMFLYFDNKLNQIKIIIRIKYKLIDIFFRILSKDS